MAIFSTTYKKTFDQIIAPIKQVIADLETHQEENFKAQTTKIAQADQLTLEAKAHGEEHDRAAAVRAKFVALIS